MREEIKPCEGATVKRIANSLDEAAKYVLVAMKSSGGWQNPDMFENLNGK